MLGNVTSMQYGGNVTVSAWFLCLSSSRNRVVQYGLKQIIIIIIIIQGKHEIRMGNGNKFCVSMKNS